MKEPRHDDERLAALLEGRLEGPERDELLAYLATAGEDLQVFAKTAAVLRAMEEEDSRAAEGGVRTDSQAVEVGVQAVPPGRRELLPPPTTRSARGWRAPRWIVPAVLVGLVVLGTFGLSRRSASAAEPVTEVATRLDAGLPPGWKLPTFGPVARGPGSNGPDAERNARAAQAGVLLMDLAVAIEARNQGTTQILAARIKDQYASLGGSALDSIMALDSAGAPADRLQPHLQAATERLEDLTDRNALRLGAWTEAAWLAANSGDAAFFDDDATKRMLRRARQHSPAAREAADRVQAALDAGTRDWSQISNGLVKLREAITK